MNEFNRGTALQIARHAKTIGELRGEIEDAKELIKALDKTQCAGDLTISVSTLFLHKDHRCQVSAASAICLLRESIEMKQEQIKALSEWLRSTLSE